MLLSSSQMLRRFCCFSAAASSPSTITESSSSALNSHKKRLVFLGSPQVSACVLDALFGAASAPDSLFREPFLSSFRALEPDLCITAAYANVLPTKFLKIPSMGEICQQSLDVRKKVGSSDEELNSPPRSLAAQQEEDTEDDDIQWQADTSMEAAQQRIKEQLTSVIADMVMLSTNEKKKEKMPKAANRAHGSSRTALATKDDTKADNGKTNHEKLVKGMRENINIMDALQFQSYLGTLSGSSQEVMTALYEALLEGVDKDFAKEIAKKTSYLTAAFAQNEKSQLLLLRAIEEFSKKPNPYAMNELALVLKVMYDADILEEENVMEWYDEGIAGSNNDCAVWKNAKPFIDWLQNADSEEEE